jgi:hypothetical protein
MRRDEKIKTYNQSAPAAISYSKHPRFKIIIEKTAYPISHKGPFISRFTGALPKSLLPYRQRAEDSHNGLESHKSNHHQV